jgi:hypothetical protein
LSVTRIGLRSFSLIIKGVKIISAKHGEDADPIVIRAAAERAQYEGERISETTKKALAERKARGVKLGNPTNLDEAQRKGAATNRALGKQRRAEFEEMLQVAKKAGATSAAEIAAELNARGFRTARGGDWKVSNVHRMLKEIGDAPPSSSGVSRRSPKPAPPPAPVFDRDDHLLPAGKDRILRIMDLRKIKSGHIMREIGFKPLNVSLGNAMNQGTRVSPEMSVKITDWVHRNEAVLGLS